ncbi:MAG: Gfo/Idh/MocA family oxidoreductase [Planctomycetota bacterium]
MSADGSTGVGVIGLGFMGRTHVGAFAAAAEAGHANRLVAVCDQDPARRAGEVQAGGNIATAAGQERLFDPASVAGYERPEELLADDAVELVSVCTPTDSHVDLAIAALEAGKHVLVEKPVALRHDEVARLGAAARAAEERGLHCMPALCMRFWPAWSWLKRAVADGTYGAVRSAAFQRLASAPAWNREFYQDPERTGGALIDLHIHDADFVRHLFGDPAAVVSAGSLDHVTTLYRYPDGPEHVVAEGGWNHAPGFAFRMRYVIVFEHATADFEIGRDPELLLCRDGEATPVEVDAWAGYDGEVRHLLDVIAGRTAGLVATVADAEGHARLLDAERESLRTGAAVRL